MWRRLFVPEEYTIAELHAVIQVAMGWEDQHLHAFEIRGERYGVCYSGGISFRTSAGEVHLGDFAFRERERFAYVYDFYSDWRHDVRVEKAGLISSAPRCIAGRGACPPEDTGGANRYMAALDERSLFDFMILLEELREDETLSDGSFREAARDMFDEWRPWLDRCFDRRAANAALKSVGRQCYESEGAGHH